MDKHAPSLQNRVIDKGLRPNLPYQTLWFGKRDEKGALREEPDQILLLAVLDIKRHVVKMFLKARPH
jgi:hypothetical protein